MQPQNTTLVEPGVYKMDLGVGTDGVTPSIKYVNQKGENISNYSPTMQTTTQQNNKDVQAGQKIDAMTKPVQGNPQNPNNQGNVNANVANTTGQANGETNPDGTPATTTLAPDGVTKISQTPQSGAYAYGTPATLQEGEKLGYGTDGKRYILDKAGKARNDPFADQEYEKNKAGIQREQERSVMYDSLKKNSDVAHQGMLDSIKSKATLNRAKMQETNKRYLALKTNEGFSGGQARYMSDINNGVLQDEEEKGNIRLMEIDVAEQLLIAQAVSAKTDKDFELLNKKMGELDNLRKEKDTAIEHVFKSAVAFNKSLSEQQKALDDKEKVAFEQGVKTLTTSAPALIKSYDMLKTEELKKAYLEKMSKTLRQSPEAVLGAIEDQRTQNNKEERDVRGDESRIRATDRSNRPKGGGVGTVNEFGEKITAESIAEDEKEKARIQKSQEAFGIIDNAMATNYRNEEGVPTVTAKGYLTYAAFKVFLAVAVQKGATRAEFLTRFQSRLNLSFGSGAQKGYGLTDAELTKIKKSN